MLVINSEILVWLSYKLVCLYWNKYFIVVIWLLDLFGGKLIKVYDFEFKEVKWLCIGDYWNRRKMSDFSWNLKKKRKIRYK